MAGQWPAILMMCRFHWVPHTHNSHSQSHSRCTMWDMGVCKVLACSMHKSMMNTTQTMQAVMDMLRYIDCNMGQSGPTCMIRNLSVLHNRISSPCDCGPPSIQMIYHAHHRDLSAAHLSMITHVLLMYCLQSIP